MIFVGSIKKAGGILETNYFYFDWKQSALEAMAKRQIGMWSRCDNCGLLIEPFGYCGNEECQEVEAGETTLTDSDIDELVDWFDELDFMPEESDLWDSLQNEGFDTYQNGTGSTIDGIIETIEDSLADIETALESGDRSEILAAIQAATQIYHVRGNIMADYGEYAGLDYWFVDMVRSNGFAAVFGEDEVMAYLER